MKIVLTLFATLLCITAFAGQQENEAYAEHLRTIVSRRTLNDKELSWLNAQLQEYDIATVNYESACGAEVLRNKEMRDSIIYKAFSNEAIDDFDAKHKQSKIAYPSILGKQYEQYFHSIWSILDQYETSTTTIMTHKGMIIGGVPMFLCN